MQKPKFPHNMKTENIDQLITWVNLNPVPMTEFRNYLAILEPRVVDFDPVILLLSFTPQITDMLGELETTHEYIKSKNWYQSASLIIYTEIYTEDYTEAETKFWEALLATIRTFEPAIDYHKTTKLDYNAYYSLNN